MEKILKKKKNKPLKIAKMQKNCQNAKKMPKNIHFPKNCQKWQPQFSEGIDLQHSAIQNVQDLQTTKRHDHWLVKII